MLGDVKDHGAGRIGVSLVGYGDREREVGLGVILEVDVLHVPRPDLSAVDGVDNLWRRVSYDCMRLCGW